MNKEEIEKQFDVIESKWPSPVVARESVFEMTGGMISTGYLANLDSLGEGPPKKFKCGRKVIYPVRPLLDWLIGRVSMFESTKIQTIDD
jgi:hypothetical protein